MRLFCDDVGRAEGGACLEVNVGLLRVVGAGGLLGSGRQRPRQHGRESVLVGDEKQLGGVITRQRGRESVLVGDEKQLGGVITRQHGRESVLVGDEKQFGVTSTDVGRRRGRIERAQLIAMHVPSPDFGTAFQRKKRCCRSYLKFNASAQLTAILVEGGLRARNRLDPSRRFGRSRTESSERSWS